MAYKRHNIIELESEVKRIYAEDKSSPEMYTAIKALAEALLVVKSIAFNYREADEMSHNLASDLYLKLNNSNFEIRAWTKYIWKLCYSYRNRYIREVQRVELEVKDITDLYEIKDIAFPQLEATLDGYNQSELESLVSYIPKKILEIFDSVVHYKKGSQLYVNIKISVMNTIRYNGDLDSSEILLYKLDKSYENYIKFLINVLKKKLLIYVHQICSESMNQRAEMMDLLQCHEALSIMNW